MTKRNASAARELLLNLIRQDGLYRGICVNRRYSMSTRHPFIKHLLKRGLVKVERQSSLGSRCNHSFLVPADGLYVEGPVYCPECKAEIKRLGGISGHRPGCTVGSLSYHWVPDHASDPVFKPSSSR
jgi:hypothetical protein